MKTIQTKYNIISDVRGSGLFLGIEIVHPDSKSYQPNTDLAKHIKNKIRKMNILVSTDEPYNNVIKMKPPLRFSPQDIDIVLDALESILFIQKNKDQDENLLGEAIFHQAVQQKSSLKY
ncbi:MAG TPA: hypothetical protein DGP89_03500 [Saprospirales bacterium]|nr:hypothetical protein [Saprospirales bacterium]